MEFRIAETFTAALARLDGQAQKAAKTTAFDLQVNPAAPGPRFHRIEASRDPDFWSVRANADIRSIIHKTQASFLLAYVDHHDAAYAWAERRRIEAHTNTGAIQIVEVRERVEELAAVPVVPPPAAVPPLFALLSAEQLLGIGVPPDWIADVQAATEEGFFTLAEHLPAEATEALLEYVASGQWQRPITKPLTPPIPSLILMHSAASARSAMRRNSRRRWTRPGSDGSSFSTPASKASTSAASTARHASLAPRARGRRSSPSTAPHGWHEPRRAVACC